MKILRRYWRIVFFLALTTFAYSSVQAKSVYVITDHGFDNVDAGMSAYLIDDDKITYQATLDLSDYPMGPWLGPVGLAVDSENGYLFCTHERGSSLGIEGIQIIDAKSLRDLGVIPVEGMPDLAGIVSDRAKKKVYTVYRNTSLLYSLSWNSETLSLTLDDSYPKDLTQIGNYACGLALDEVDRRLYVSTIDDHTAYSHNVYCYDIDDPNLMHLETYEIKRGDGTVYKAVAVASYNDNNGTKYLYTGAWGSLPEYYYLVRTDLNLYHQYPDDPNKAIIPQNIGTSVIGVAVDPNTGLVYVTTYNNRVAVYDTSNWVYDPNMPLIEPNDYVTGNYIDGPAGICVPTQNVYYKYPINLTKTDNIGSENCVSPEADDPNITYTINFTPNAYDNYDTVLVDYLPRSVDYVAGSADPDYGVYNPLTHTVTWDIGDLPAYDPQDPDPNVYFHIIVQVNSLAEPLSAITNRVEIESDVSYDVAANTTGICCWSGDIIYVNADAPASSAQTGTRWEDAYTDLQDALARAASGCGSEIWIAQGFYSPGNQAADTFDIPAGVSLFGGFNGGETDRSQRNYLLNQTHLVGPVDYVVTMNGAVSAAPLDGLIIDNATKANISCTGGEPNLANCIIQNSSGDGVYCNHSDPIIENCLVKLNHSAGIYCYNYSDPNISHCLIRQNDKGIRIDSSSAPEITNCWIDHNDNGGIIFDNQAADDAIIRNNTIVCNDYYGIYLAGGNPQITSCILWGNQWQLYGCSTTYSCIESLQNPDNGNINEDPNFAYGLNNPSYNYHLDPGSPCKDAGDSEVINTGELDIDGDERIIDGYVDMGADEIACSDVSQELDLNADGVINFHEYARLAYAWLSHDPNDPEFTGDPNECTNWNARFDFDADYDIDLADLAFFCTDFWLWTACWRDDDSGMMMSRSMGPDFSTKESFSSVSLSEDQLEQARLTRWLRTRPAYEPTDYERLHQLRDLLDWLDLLWQQDEDLRKQFTEDQWFDWMKSIYDQILELERRYYGK